MNAWTIHSEVLQGLRVPKAPRVAATLLLIVLGIFTGCLALIPWQQSSTGRGRVVARDSETEEYSVEGSGLTRWLDATFARMRAVLFPELGSGDASVLSGAKKREPFAAITTVRAVSSDQRRSKWRRVPSVVAISAGRMSATRAAFSIAFAGWIAEGETRTFIELLDIAVGELKTLFAER